MKKIIFSLLVLFLCLPWLQERFHIFSLKPLNGISYTSQKPEFDIKYWMDGSFQINLEKYYEENFGLRSLFIRIFNQFDFTFFKKPHSWVTIGKNNYLFEEDYINEYIGSNYIGDDSIKFKISKIHLIENYLNSKNILLITVLAPAKSDYYNEYLPERSLKKISPKRNYLSLLNYSKEKNIRLLDLNNLFLQMKDTATYPLFPKYGIHWNTYGLAYASDTLIKFIEKEIKKCLPKISWTLELSDTLKGTDYDLADLLNIYKKLPYEKMAYPNFTIKEDPGCYRPRLLVIADSFYWTIYNESLFRRIFNNETFYYYCSTIYPDGITIAKNAHDLNILKEIEKYDVILLLQSSANYDNPGLGFIQLVNNELNRSNAYRQIASKIIMENQIYLNRIKVLASENNIPNDSAKSILIDSLVNDRLEKISQVKIQMRYDSIWFKQILDKSKEKNITPEQAMQIDAEWLLDKK